MDISLLEYVGLIFLLLVLFCGAYWYLYFRYDYWELRKVPFVPGQHFIGSQKEFYTKAAHDVEVERYRKWGKIYGYYEGRKPALSVADPDLIRNILVKDFQSFTGRRDLTIGESISDNMVTRLSGEKWKRMRSIISPTFSTGKIKKMTSIILDSAEVLCQNFDNAIQTRSTINAKRLFGAFTMDVIASSAFATKIDSHNDPDNRFVQAARKVFSGKLPVRFILFFMFPKLFRLLRLPLFDKSAMDFFKDVTLNIIQERKRTGQVRNDFLQLLMDASELSNKAIAADGTEDHDDESQTFKMSGPQKKLNEDELIGQCIIFFLAGYETTASTLAFTTYKLALNPECQEKLIQEIDRILAENKGNITYEGIQSMKYLDNVISETLRIYPPAIRVERHADEDYVLGDTGIVIPKGMMVGMPVYALHHDAELFPEPEKFDPDRFTPEAKAGRHQYIYLPFGAGPRNCVGMRFALMEVKICLAKLFSQFRVKKSPETKEPLDFHIGQILLQAKEILLAVERRKDTQ